jgi:Ca2+-binding RTX toxin-like protein
MSAAVARIRNSRKRITFGLIFGSALVAGMLTIGGTAHAAVSCGVSGNQLNITLGAAGDDVTVSRDGAGQISTTTCGAVVGATVTAIDQINVDAPAAGGQEIVTIDETNGLFAPGNTSETGGLNEIEFNLDTDFALADADGVIVLGQNGAADTINAGTAGINLNGDTDQDVFMLGSVATDLGLLNISGQDGNDTLSAAGGNSSGTPITTIAVTISGGNGTDNITGSDNAAGPDVLNGDSDNDTINGDSAGSGVGGVDTISGGADADTMNGDDGADTIYGCSVAACGSGTADDDTITGGAGDDVVDGGYAQDNISGNAGQDTLTGGRGVDTIDGGTEDDTIAGQGGGSGNDIVSIVNGTTGNTLTGGDGNDFITGGSQDDTINANDGSDRVLGGTGDDTIDGGPGNDSSATGLVMGGVDTTGVGAAGGPGVLAGEAGNDTIGGNAGNDLLLGGADSDSLTGGTGNDVENGEAGNDSYHQGATPDGSDVVSTDGATIPAGAADTGTDILDYASRTVDVRVDVTNFAGTFPSTGDDGNAAAGEFDDIGADVNTVNTGSGNDVFDALGKAGPYTVNLSDGLDAARGSSGNDIINGGNGNDSQNTGAFTGLNGGPGNDAINGNAGNDVLRGDADDDTLTGGAGDDNEDGGADTDSFNQEAAANGNDVLVGSAGTDTANYSARTANLTLNNNGANGSGDTGASESDTISLTVEVLTAGSGNDTLTNGAVSGGISNGNSGNDTFDGNAVGGVFNGGSGTGPLTSGADTFISGDNGQTFNGNDGTDTVSYAGKASGVTVTVDGAADDGNGTDGNVDNVAADIERVVGSSSGDNITGRAALASELLGGNGDDHLQGGSNTDTLRGQLGDDQSTLLGGAGADLLDGGPGNDTINGEANNDVITGSTQTLTGSTDVPKTVADCPPGCLTPVVTDSTLSGPAGTIADADVRVDVEHTFDADLRFVLESPTGTMVTLTDGLGSSGDNYTNTVFDDEAATAIASGAAPFAGRFIPQGPLSALDGQSSAGTWTLHVFDDANLDLGTINGWSIEFLLNTGSHDGQDEIVGGTGTDLYDASARTANLTVTLNDGGQGSCFAPAFGCAGNDGQTGESDDLGNVGNPGGQQDLENVYLGSGNDSLVGNALANLIRGNAGDDTIQTLSGNDTVNGNNGNDTFIEDEAAGANGDDAITGDAGTDEVRYNGRSGNLTLRNNGAGGSGDTGGGESDTIATTTEILDGGRGADTFQSAVNGTVFNGNTNNDTYTAQNGGNDASQTFNGDGTGTGGLNTTSGAVVGTLDFADYGVRVVPLNINVNNSPSPSTGSAGEQDTLNTDVERVDGGTVADTITSGVSGGVLNGNNGNDTLSGTSAVTSQTLNGDAGNDIIDGGNGDDAENGGAGNDTFRQVGSSPNGNDIMSGDADIDTATYDFATRSTAVNISNDGAANDGETGLGEADNILNNVEHLIGGRAGGSVVCFGANCVGEAGTGSTGTSLVCFGTNCVLFGNDGADVLQTFGDNSAAFGGNGNDTVLTTGDNSLASGENGDDFVQCTGNTDVICTADGGDGNDIVVNGNGANAGTAGSVTSLNGGDGNDDILGGAADDAVNGGNGNDYIQGQGDQSAVAGGFGDIICGGECGATNSADGGDMIFGDDDQTDGSDPNTQTTLLGTAGIDRLNGDNGESSLSPLAAASGEDTLWGGPGNDLLFGNGGEDVMREDDSAFVNGADLLSGQAGTDEVSYEDRHFSVNASIDGVANDGASCPAPGTCEGDNIGTDVENLTGTLSGDVLTGSNLNNVINGLAGADTLNGDSGDDTLNGGDDEDVLNGGPGNNTVNGGGEADTISFAASAVGVRVELNLGTAIHGPYTDSLGGVENVEGSPLNDIISGDSGANVLDGLGGNDIMLGRGADDDMNGGNGDDQARYTFAPSAVIANLTTGTATGGDGNDSLNGFETLIGSAFNDSLSGDAGVNHLVGMAGNDRLNGGAAGDALYGLGGNDTLVGGPGRDAATGGDGNDRVDIRDGENDVTASGGNGARDCIRRDAAPRDRHISGFECTF